MIKVLIVDDVDYIRKSISKVLEANDFECDTCENGKIAMEMVVEKTYDLIVTDIMMPEVDGYEFLDFIRSQHDPLCKTPVLAISGGDKTINSDVALGTIRTKANDILQKPFAKADLLAAITKVLEDSKHNMAMQAS